MLVGCGIRLFSIWWVSGLMFLYIVIWVVFGGVSLVSMNRCWVFSGLYCRVFVIFISIVFDGFIFCFCFSQVYQVMLMLVSIVIFFWCRFGVCWWFIWGNFRCCGLRFLWWVCRKVFSCLC